MKSSPGSPPWLRNQAPDTCAARSLQRSLLRIRGLPLGAHNQLNLKDCHFFAFCLFFFFLEFQHWSLGVKNISMAWAADGAAAAWDAGTVLSSGARAGRLRMAPGLGRFVQAFCGSFLQIRPKRASASPKRQRLRKPYFLATRQSRSEGLNSVIIGRVGWRGSKQ